MGAAWSPLEAGGRGYRTFRQRRGEKYDNVEHGPRDMAGSLDVHSGLLWEELIFFPGTARDRCRVSTVFSPSRFPKITKL